MPSLQSLRDAATSFPTVQALTLTDEQFVTDARGSWAPRQFVETKLGAVLQREETRRQVTWCDQAEAYLPIEEAGVRYAFPSGKPR